MEILVIDTYYYKLSISTISPIIDNVEMSKSGASHYFLKKRKEIPMKRIFIHCEHVHYLRLERIKEVPSRVEYKLLREQNLTFLR